MNHSAVIFFDIKQAFDSVWHEGLIYKLFDLKLPDYIIRWLISFLSERTAAIELENLLSQTFGLKSGTPQGSPPSPLLYILFTADSMDGLPFYTDHGLFADDTALWTSCNTASGLNRRLQESMNVVARWCEISKVTLQSSKTEMLHFSVHRRKQYKNQVQVIVGAATIRPQAHARYLEVIYDKTLSWKEHVNHVKEKVNSKINLLRFLSRSIPESNDRIMVNLFKSLIRPVLTFGVSILLKAEHKIWQELQTL
ncbi:unnamed protein product [Didymodactylos carnosus]|uniref:Reverse transcriptase domain-containing protein n=1 Tax=Didymodactylos carnosus TaxID=1234261 RepID=A0A814X8D2_9BILA|nr:unnamed protein product [Didymodactylos carnosus]CAF3976676.1 unnamed protein product [Didymodactylos carnosus]